MTGSVSYEQVAPGGAKTTVIPSPETMAAPSPARQGEADYRANPEMSSLLGTTCSCGPARPPAIDSGTSKVYDCHSEERRSRDEESCLVAVRTARFFGLASGASE